MGLPLSAYDILQRSVVEHCFNQQAFQLAIFRLQCLESLRLRHRQAAEFGLPVIVRRIADALLAAYLSNLHARFSLFQNPDYVFFRESILHACLLVGRLYISAGLI